MSNEVVVLEPDDIIGSGLSGFNEKELPKVIQGQISKLNELDKSVKKAMKAAASAKDSAISARNMSAGFGKKRVAIEELQSAGMDLAEAVQSGAEAQKISFEFQTKLAEITKYLFGLGVSNIASNRFVVRELEMKLKGASKEELSQLARQELLLVVKQLKEQEDVLRKQENFSAALRVYDNQLKTQLHMSQQMDEQLQAQAEVDQLHSEQLRNHAETSKRLEADLIEQARLSQMHSDQLNAQEVADKLQDEQIKGLDDTAKRLEEKIQAQAEVDQLHAEQLRSHEAAGKKLESQLQAQAEVVKMHDEQLRTHEAAGKRFESQLQEREEVDKLHDGKLQAHAEAIKSQGEQLKSQSENVKRHDEQLAVLQEENKGLDEETKSHLATIEEQAAKIAKLEEEMGSLKLLLESKASNTSAKFSLVISAIALAAAVSHFFL